jgi:hypothetical protein
MSDDLADAFRQFSHGLLQRPNRFR